MPSFRTTWHFEQHSKPKHPEANRPDWIERVLTNPNEPPSPDPLYPHRTRYFGYIQEAGKYMRVVVEPAGAVLTAFFDGNYTNKTRRRNQP